MSKRLRQFLAHPLTRNLAVDDPQTTALRRQIIRSKPFLLAIYQDWYDLVLAHRSQVDGALLELGSGAGFLDQRLPELITSEVFCTPGIKVVLDAQHLPFPPASLSNVFLIDVLHHIPRPADFLREAAQCVAPGGRVVMLEPWHTPWSRIIYTHLHSEPFQPQAGWEIPASGPLSGANGALPWILLQRDRQRFQQELPQWSIQRIQPCMPLRYLVSGGVSMRNLMPSWSTPIWRLLERILQPAMHKLGMFALIVLERNEHI